MNTHIPDNWYETFFSGINHEMWEKAGTKEINPLLLTKTTGKDNINYVSIAAVSFEIKKVRLSEFNELPYPYVASIRWWLQKALSLRHFHISFL